MLRCPLISPCGEGRSRLRRPGFSRQGRVLNSLFSQKPLACKLASLSPTVWVCCSYSSMGLHRRYSGSASRSRGVIRRVADDRRAAQAADRLGRRIHVDQDCSVNGHCLGVQAVVSSQNQKSEAHSEKIREPNSRHTSRNSQEEEVSWTNLAARS